MHEFYLSHEEIPVVFGHVCLQYNYSCRQTVKLVEITNILMRTNLCAPLVLVELFRIEPVLFELFLLDVVCLAVFAARARACFTGLADRPAIAKRVLGGIGICFPSPLTRPF